MADTDISEELQPTPVEEGLVRALREHRGEWPYAYLEMKKVSKENLLADAEYCSRHKHPSLTQFLRECADIADTGISPLRRYQRAGKFYERMGEVADLPPITDSRVCHLSPDTIIYIDQIYEIAYPAAGDSSLVEDVAYQLLFSLVMGWGMERKELRKWIALLENAKEAGELDKMVDNLFGELIYQDYERGLAATDVLRHATVEARVRPLIEEGLWLQSVVEPGRFENANAGMLDLVDEPEFVLDDRMVMPDYAVAETLTDSDFEVCIHAIEVKKQLQDGRLSQLGTLSRCCDYVWLVLNADVCSSKTSWKRMGLDEKVGVMLFDEGELTVLRPAERQVVDAEMSLVFCKEMMKHNMKKKAVTSRAVSL